ncbi:MAG: O-antigen ligase family protein [Phycisphaerae bacterium]|nr:O-antigen ligase family protein [Phycisphaerae bacterium]
MNRVSVGHNELRPSRFDIMIERLVVVLLVFMPLAFGARHRWSEEVVMVLSAAITVCFLLKLAFGQDEPFLKSWAYAPIVIFVLLAVFQLILLPFGVVNFISPETAALKAELLGDLTGGKNSGWMSLSFYQHVTRHDLRLLLSLSCVFIAVVNVYRYPEQIKRLLKAIALIGGLIAVIALAQDVFGNGKIYWFVPIPGTAKSGTFVNHNHFAQFMNLSIGAAIGWLCIRMHEDFDGKKITLAYTIDYLTSPVSRGLRLFLVIISLCMAAIFVSLSRGGVISMLVAGSIIFILFVRQNNLQWRGWIIVVASLFGFVCILFVGFDAVCQRLATLGRFEGYDFRRQTLTDLLACFGRFPVFGTGSGTHSVVYPMFQKIPITLLFTHAENEYAELLEEYGLIGLGGFAIFSLIVWSRFVKLIRFEKPGVQSAAFGLGFGLAAVYIHSLSDYGQHVPANAFVSCIFCALMIGLSRQGNLKPVKNTAKIAVGVFIIAIPILAWILIGANNARVAESHWSKTLDIEKKLVGKNWQASETEYAELISNAKLAVKYEPENVDYLYCLGVYKWYSISKPKDAVVYQTPANIDQIVTRLNQARISCPTYGPIYSVLGQIELFMLNDSSGVEKIRKGLYLAPNDPIACFIAGRLDIFEGKKDDAVVKFARAVKLKANLFREVVDICVKNISRPKAAIAIAGDEIGRLNYVAGVLDSMRYRDLADSTRVKVKTLLEVKCTQSDAATRDFVALADIYKTSKDYHSAIKCYRKAIGLDYAQIGWRMSLAKSLAETGQIQKAIDEARICLRIKPKYAPAEKLIADLSVSPDLIGKDLGAAGSVQTGKNYKGI